MRAMSISERLAQHASRVRFGDIPASARAAAKRALLDTLAVGWAGSQAPGCQAVWQLQHDRGGAAESTVWGFGGYLPASSAALINGMSAAALEYDGLHGGFHSDACVVPAALAMAEQQRATGAELLTAQVVGTDIGCRLVAATGLGRDGWWDTPLFGAFGACAAAISLLRLDTTQGAHAFGLVFARAGGTMQLNMERSLAKRIASGMAAAAGIEAALLAAAGVTAPREIFEGRYGLFRMYQADQGPALLEELGTRFAVEGGSMKAYPSCACTHAAIWAAQQLMRQQGLHPVDVASVRVSVSAYVAGLVGAPFDVAPGDQVGAQFSIRYAIACAIQRGGMRVADLEPAAIADPAVRRLAERVSVEVDPSNDSPRACTVTLRTAAGAEFALRADHAPGDPPSPLSNEELLAKAHDCLSQGVHPLTPDEALQVIQAVDRLDSLPGVDRLHVHRFREASR